jgi:hypothetical protein
MDLDETWYCGNSYLLESFLHWKVIFPDAVCNCLILRLRREYLITENSQKSDVANSYMYDGREKN